MKLNKDIFHNNKVNLGILALVLCLGLWQAHRSSWTGTFAHLTRLVSYKVFNEGKVNGHAITTRLDATWHRQEHSLSCEVAALKMALSAVGLEVPESTLLAHLDYDPTRRSSGIWGDPYTGFVGDIDGRMGVTGYGVYWDPIAKIGNNYLRTETEQLNPQLLAEHISKGRGVVAWGYFGKGKRITWTTPAGKQINAVNGEHARTVVGFSGEIHNPTGFIVFDPIYGQQYWSTENLFKNWEPFDYMGVVVYPQSELL